MGAAMKLYRVHFYEQRDGSRGYVWFTERQAAESNLRKFDKDNRTAEDDRRPDRIEVVEIVPTKAGILNALNHWASHADNG
jgi:hypothetical protein